MSVNAAINPVSPLLSSAPLSVASSSPSLSLSHAQRKWCVLAADEACRESLFSIFFFSFAFHHQCTLRRVYVVFPCPPAFLRHCVCSCACACALVRWKFRVLFSVEAFILLATKDVRNIGERREQQSDDIFRANRRIFMRAESAFLRTGLRRARGRIVRAVSETTIT